MFFKKRIFSSKKNLRVDLSNTININDSDLDKIHLNVQGKNNIIEIKSLSEKMIGSLDISIYGDNCSVHIDENFYTSYGVFVLLGLNHENYGKINNSHLKIGKNTTIEGGRIITFNSNNTICIGNDCMFSENIMLYNTDSHPIYDKRTGKIINYVTNMTIGNHVWLGMNVKILKNSSVADDSIVGADSLVTKKFLVPNSVLAGVPARVVRQNVDWKRSDIKWIKGEL